ncbi:MAG TPA: response regulator, partial [Burkholderiaceae bacterium]|nr:response regulator [Burkholderiaceae bacterium]
VYPKAAPLEAEAVRELLTVLQAQVRPAAAPMRIIRGEDTPNETQAHVNAQSIQPDSLDEASAPEHALAHETLSEDAPSTAPVIASTVHDTLDPELLEIFQTEAHDLLPAIASHLRSLAANPNEREVARELMRQLHTLKGSARMAGAMRLGELVHNMETRIEAAMQLADVPLVIIEALQTQHDQALSLFDRLSASSDAQTHTSTEATAPESDGDQPTLTDAALAHKTHTAPPNARPQTTAPASASAQPAPASFIRVRSDVLDKLVDRAGEVAIARSKLETEIGTLKGSLTDLTENIGRLRGQLREMEIQADAQIQARAGQLDKASDAFDPLEYDRYTRLQELTRMLAESVEDVAMVQTNMIKGLSLADNDLGSQSRITRELQQQLMRVRLVPFSTLSERLYRVARQASKELDKRVNLEIVGGNIEVDRGVLERMAGPFEHLVRNCIVHGLETAQQRIAAGKAEAGELTIAARQEGNEIIVQVADDGGGIDLERVRIRALERGLIRSDQAVSDRDAMELIFSPGFSTAEAVTELAGRGVGMDVVRSELSSFGGRIAVSSVRGKGTRFTLYLPITLSIAQVVLATVGSRRYALPSGMVEQVRRVRQKQLEPAMATGSITFNPVGEVVLRPLAQLLGEDVVLPTQNKQRPVVLLRSGDDRLAIVVDDVSSSQEVVVKNVGQQVSRLAGILGATIMGNGEIVLIINPVPLIARAPEPVRFEPIPDNAPESSRGEYARREAPMQAAATVMVVDDSLTVRRVTQRFLERHGFQVMLAKDGVDALRQMQDTLPDILLVDIEMPRMDGYDLTRNVRSGQTTQDIPIIMITSRTAEKHRKVAFEVGVNEYLGKPYQEDELLAHIQRHLSKRHRSETAAT